MGSEVCLLCSPGCAVPAGVAALTRIAASGGCEAVACIMTPRARPPMGCKKLRRGKGDTALPGRHPLGAGAAMIGHALVTSVRRRRRGCLLKTLGLSPTPQVAASVAWQASAFVVIGPWLGCPPGSAMAMADFCVGGWGARHVHLPSQGTLGGARCAYPGEPDRGAVPRTRRQHHRQRACLRARMRNGHLINRRRRPG